MAAPSRRRRSRNQRPAPPRSSDHLDLWQPKPMAAAPEPIVPVSDPTALVTSLGFMPLRGHGAAAEPYIAAVVERAAGLAAALAASADILVLPGDES